MRKWVYRFVVATMYFNAGLIPWYILMVNLGLKNNFLLYILPSAVGAYYVRTSSPSRPPWRNPPRSTARAC